ncbi:MAG: hypothetical protein AAB850_00485 [Patescibacteria group bacterium]
MNSNSCAVPPPPVVSITANPPRVYSGDPSTISWSATQVNSCAISGPGVSATGLTGSRTPTISAQSTYTITCQTNGAPLIPLIDSVIVNIIISDFTEF